MIIGFRDGVIVLEGVGVTLRGSAALDGVTVLDGVIFLACVTKLTLLTVSLALEVDKVELTDDFLRWTTVLDLFIPIFLTGVGCFKNETA